MKDAIQSASSIQQKQILALKGSIQRLWRMRVKMLRLPAEWLSIDQVVARTDDLALHGLTVWVSGGKLGTNYKSVLIIHRKQSHQYFSQ